MNKTALIKKSILALNMKKFGIFAFLTGFALISEPAHAQSVNQIGANIINSLSTVPGALSGLSYLLGMMFGVGAIIDMKNHVENPGNTPIRKPAIKAVAGGMLFALPMVFSAMAGTIGGGVYGFGIGLMNGLDLNASDTTAGTINGIFANIVNSVGSLPGMLSGISYLGGILLGITGILKLKEHVENPDNVGLREPVVRFIIGGALFALPTVFATMYTMISNALVLPGNIIGGGIVPMESTEAAVNNNCEAASGGNTVGAVICTLADSSNALPALLTAASYMFGMVLGVWGIYKIRDHALNPGNVSLWDGATKLIAGGAFFALPMVVYSIRASVVSDAQSSSAARLSGFNETATSSCDQGLDSVLYCFMSDIFGPLGIVINVFAIIAGVILIMVGISRLIKGANDGAKAPGGFGTIMTFVTGGALISSYNLVRTFSTSIFSDSVTNTYATLAFTDGMTAAELAHAHTVISAILKFMFIIGLISFVRGIFIIRNVAEGNGQASIMAGVTHLVGGALAVNLGPLMAAVQWTLGITDYGIRFA